MRSFFFKLSLTVALITLNQCKVAGEKRPTTQSTGESVLNYFLFENYAINSLELTNALSRAQGITMTAEGEANFDLWSEPEKGCLYSIQDGFGFSPKRAVNIGDVLLNGENIEATTLGIDPDTLTFAARGRLPMGDYSISADATALKFDQVFKVLNEGADLQLYSDGDDNAQFLPSPDIPAPSDPDYIVTIKKTRALGIAYTAPEGTNYVKIIVSDGLPVTSANPQSSITCYYPPDEVAVIPATAMNYFRSTDDGKISIDFVSVSVENDLGKINESLILSSIRHIHGLMDFYTNEQNQTARFGKLRFE